MELLLHVSLALLRGDASAAEDLYVAHGAGARAMQMYQELHREKDSMRVARRINHPELAQLQATYFQWLLQTGQQQVRLCVVLVF